MITVGYGDVTPINTTERLFVIVVMLISCGVFAYSLSSIGRIVEELQKRDALFRDNIQQLTAYLKQVYPPFTCSHPTYLFINLRGISATTYN